MLLPFTLYLLILFCEIFCCCFLLGTFFFVTLFDLCVLGECAMSPKPTLLFYVKCVLLGLVVQSFGTPELYGPGVFPVGSVTPLL